MLAGLIFQLDFNMIILWTILWLYNRRHVVALNESFRSAAYVGRFMAGALMIRSKELEIAKLLSHQKRIQIDII